MSERGAKSRTWIGPVLTVALVMLGLALRTAQYLHNRALWLDEAALAVNIVQRGFGELLEPMIYHQNSPFAFLFSVELTTRLLGTGEHALRLMPFLWALASVPLFAWMMAEISRDEEGAIRWNRVVIGTAFFATAKHLIFYANELRHYSTDVALCCLLVAMTARLLRHDPNTVEFRRSLMTLGVVGLVSVWFSLAMFFVLAGAGSVVLVCALRSRSWSAVVWVAAVGIFWMVSFGAHNTIHSRNIEARNLRGDIEHNLAKGFFEVPPRSGDEARRLRDGVEQIFSYPGGMTRPGLAFFACAAGSVALLRRRPALAFLLALPGLYAICASGMSAYPFWGRYVLFAMPAMAALIVEAPATLLENRERAVRTMGFMLCVFLFLQPFAHGLRIFARSYDFGDDPRPLVAHLKTHWREDDAIYLPFHQVPPFHYYLPRAGFSEDQFEREPIFTEVVENNEAYRRAYMMERLPVLFTEHERLWIVFRDGAGYLPSLTKNVGEVDDIGRLMEVVPGGGMTLYRYEAD